MYSCEFCGLCIHPLQFLRTHLRPKIYHLSLYVNLPYFGWVHWNPSQELFCLYTGPLHIHTPLKLTRIFCETWAIIYAMCVITVGCCVHAVPWLIVIGYHYSFLVELCCPPCVGTELKKQAARSMCNILSRWETWLWLNKKVVRLVRDSLQVRECAEEVRTPGRSFVDATELEEFWSDLLLKPKEREV